MDEAGENDLRSARVYTDGRRYLDAIGNRLIDHHGWTADEVDELLGAVGTPLLGRRAAELHVIRPAELLPGDTLEFDPDIMRANLELGIARARETWGDVPLYAAAP
jgi:hypothetical protein